VILIILVGKAFYSIIRREFVRILMPLFWLLKIPLKWVKAMRNKSFDQSLLILSSFSIFLFSLCSETKEEKKLNICYVFQCSESHKTIAQYMSALDAEVTYHKFYPQLNQFHPLHFFTSPDSGIISKNISCSSLGINIAGIIRAPRGDGKEAIVLVTPYNPKKVGPGEALSLGIAYSVFSLLSRVTWLAKDVIWLVADSQYGEYSAVSAWLREYQAPVFHEAEIVNTETCNDSIVISELGQNPYSDRNSYGGFRRAGTMAAALVIKVDEQGNHHEDSLNIYPEASNGQMPNLDLINIVNYLGVHKTGLRIKVKKMFSLLGSRWLNTLGGIFESLGRIARSLNPQWKFGISATEYVEGAATLASSMYSQVVNFYSI